MVNYRIEQYGSLTFLQPASGKFLVALDNSYGRWQLFDGPASGEQKAEITTCLIESPVAEPSAPDDDYLEVVIFITDRCNLGCVYCKYADLTQIPEVRSTNTDRIERTLLELIRGKRQVRITFQGGEPLLMHHQIEHICTFLTGGFPEIDFSFALQSNGTLFNDQILATLQRYDITVGITIDGPAIQHDLTRPFKNGKGSFAAITANLERLRGGVRYGVLSVIREPGELMELFRFNRETLGLNSFYLKPLEFADCGAEKSEEFSTYYGALADRQLELMRELLRIHRTEGEAVHEQMLRIVLGKMFMPSLHNDGCIRTPSCGSNERYKSIDCDGSEQWCAHLKDQQNDAIKQLSKERYGFCTGCPVSSICLSFCPAVIPGYRHGDPEACYLPLARHFCLYRRQTMMGLFELMHEDMAAVTGYFMNG